MIIIDGRESNLALANYANLEEVLVDIASQDAMSNRIVTDVLVNKEPFSELYPHQAEDITAEHITNLELITVSQQQMTADILGELPKVVVMINSSSKAIAQLFRTTELAEALEMLQDMIAVSRDLLATIGIILDANPDTNTVQNLMLFSEKFSNLLEEIGDSMQNEDWMLVADLMEFELVPECDKLGAIVDSFGEKYN